MKLTQTIYICSILVYKFTTCGSKGRLGPSNRSCEAAYTNSTVSVIVVNDTHMDGVQIWHVPETGVYTYVFNNIGENYNIMRHKHNKTLDGVIIF